MSAPTFSVEQIRAAEAPLIEGAARPDELMQKAAHAVAQAARLFTPDSVLLLVGTGGNGGDALYAGAELALAGVRVDAYLVSHHAHERGLEAFTNAGGQEARGREVNTLSGTYDLIIDGITDIGGSAGLRADLADIVTHCAKCRARVLSVDVPSGVAADTGESGDLHITADATVTFGGWRHAHALAPECGLQLLAHIPELDARLAEAEPSPIRASRAVLPDWGQGLELPDGLSTLPQATTESVVPGPADDKHSGGVVGIRAGSGTYPGAALLPVSAALHATPAMVRYAGPQALEVVRRHPEVIVTKTLGEAGRVQAWVFGPGAGTDDAAAEELAWILRQEVPVLVDADGLTLLATRPKLRELVARREEPTVLTPHDGEFTRLQVAAGTQRGDRYAETAALAKNLHATVLRKGRATIVVPEGDPQHAEVIDAGHSWAATPGSGDVLSGIIGARLATPDAGTDGSSDDAAHKVVDAVHIHAAAAKLAAHTAYGDAPAPAGRIAQFVREATAKTSS